MNHPSLLQVATDGSCYPNPGPGGWAWVAQDGSYAAGAFTEGTNNVGELTAIKMALLDHPEQPLEILYDSQYAANCVTIWGPSWVEKARRAVGDDWRQALAHKPNIDLILETMSLLTSRPAHACVIWTWVKGHDADNTYPLNTTVDRIAGSMTGRPDGYIERGTTAIDTVVPSKKRAPRKKKKADPLASLEAQLADASERPVDDPGDSNIRCAHNNCNASVPTHYWSKVKSGSQGWFHQKNGHSWCPDHVPSWVAGWRASKDQ